MTKLGKKPAEDKQNTASSSNNAHSATLNTDFDNFKEDTTLHGFKYIFNRDLHICSRLIWTVVLIAMFIALIVSFVQSLVRYYNYETYTSVNIKRISELTMPAITFCNINIFPNQLLKSIYPGLSATLEAASLVDHGDVDISANLSAVTSEEYLKQFENVTYYDIISLTYSIEKIFLMCRVGNDYFPCSEYLKAVITTSGTCYTFNSYDFLNSNESIKTYQAGEKYGLAFLIDIFPDDYILSKSFGEGIEIQIHNPEEFPYIETNNIRISPGEETSIAIHKNEMNILPPPYSNDDCVSGDNAKIYGKLYHPTLPYTESLCKHNCSYKHIYNCGCDALTPSGPSSCTFFQVFTCARENYKLFLNGENHCNCKPRCEYTEYTKHISSTVFPNINTLKLAEGFNWTSNTFEEMNRRLAMVTIYFDSMMYTEMKQLPVTELVQLLANFGGQLGLFTGASIITVFEFLDFSLVVILYKKMLNTFGRRKPKNAIKLEKIY